MYRFFVTSKQLEDNPIRISGEDYNHIRNVLRLKQGEHVYLADGTEKEYMCSIEGFDSEAQEVILTVRDIFSVSRELPAKITLYQGYPKGDKMETIVQKAVELGAYQVAPVSMKRCVVKLDDKKAAKKTERLNAIALNAAKQSKRGVIPKVLGVMSFEEACEHAKSMDYILFPYENAEGMEHSYSAIKGAMDKKNIGVFIGPEGGFEKEEAAILEELGAQVFSLGHRILRTETAGMTVLSLLMFLLECGR